MLCVWFDEVFEEEMKRFEAANLGSQRKRGIGMENSGKFLRRSNSMPNRETDKSLPDHSNSAMGSDTARAENNPKVSHSRFGSLDVAALVVADEDVLDVGNREPKRSLEQKRPEFQKENTDGNILKMKLYSPLKQEPNMGFPTFTYVKKDRYTTTPIRTCRVKISQFTSFYTSKSRYYFFLCARMRGTKLKQMLRSKPMTQQVQEALDVPIDLEFILEYKHKLRVMPSL